MIDFVKISVGCNLVFPWKCNQLLRQKSNSISKEATYIT